MRHLLAAVAVMTALVAVGCKKTADVPPIGEWDQFNDQFFRTTFTYPKTWQVQKEPTRVTVTSSAEAMQKFFDPYSKNPAGAQLVIAGDKQDSVVTLESVVEAYKKDLNESGYQITATNAVTLDGNPAVEIAYGGRFNQETALKAIRTISYKDTVVYYVHFGGFNEFFEPYKSVYDSALHSAILPKPKVAQKAVDPSMPVEETDKFSDDHVEFMYPSNFSPTLGKPSKDVEYAMEIKGLRDDIKVSIDMRASKSVSVDKIVEQNTKNLKGVSKATDATVAGIAGKMVTYAPVKGIDARMYFVVKGEKFTRIIVFWPSSLKKETLPALEKTIASLKLK